MMARTRSVGAFAAFALAAFAAPAGAAEEAAVPKYTIEQFMKTLGVRGASFSPDRSKILVSTDATGVFNAYAIPSAGGEPAPLTHSEKESIFAISYFPKDERILYTADEGGNEQNHIFVRETDGAVKDLTPGEKVKAMFHAWAADDRSFFASTNERDPKFFDLYEFAADGYERKLLYKNESGYDFADISRDRRRLALQRVKTEFDTDIYLLDLQTGETKHLTPHNGEIRHSPQTFSPDGAKLLYLTDDGSEFLYLAAIDLPTGKKTAIEKLEWDITFASYTKKGSWLVAGVNEDSRSRVRLYDAKTMKPAALPESPSGEIAQIEISDDERAIAFYTSGSRTPSDLYAADFPGGAPRRLTNRLNPEINPAHLVDGEIVRFKSYDGTTVPGVLFKPRGALASNKVPALVWVHGGPGGQTTPAYTPLIQYLVNHGYAVYGINNRGSSGYGKTFFAMDDRKHGSADLDDCVASKRMLAETGWVDPERIGIIGGSYGGYMVCAALAFRPEAFRAGVDIFGVTNWVRTLKSIPSWWESQRVALYKELGDPATDEDYLRSISPLFHAKNIRRPMMVLQGANDPRVLKVESDEMVEAARANGVPVEYVVFDDEGHGFRKRENQIRGYEAVLRFLDAHLKG